MNLNVDLNTVILSYCPTELDSIAFLSVNLELCSKSS